MNGFLQLSPTLVIAVATQLLCQLFKVLIYSLRDRRFSLRYFATAGGIPSSHSAFVTALAVAVGLRAGFNTEVFAVAFVFSAIVIYDAYRLRGAVEQHAKLLNRLTAAHFPNEYLGLNEMLGHTPLEILSGIVTGGALSWLAASLWP